VQAFRPGSSPVRSGGPAGLRRRPARRIVPWLLVARFVSGQARLGVLCVLCV